MRKPFFIIVITLFIWNHAIKSLITTYQGYKDNTLLHKNTLTNYGLLHLFTIKYNIIDTVILINDLDDRKRINRFVYFMGMHCKKKSRS